jgi:peptidoglycan/LPS O-acetylase OafA/YrhL
VAVVLVVGYHFFPQEMPGGFVGVDVFFVISGFLISAHLFRELERTGTISLPNFWARRVRRLLPAAVVVLVFCVVMSLILVPPRYLSNILGQIAASAAYVENWFRFVQATTHSVPGGPIPPTLHYWSLSVEEQFYLVWPLLLLILFAVGARWRRRKAADSASHRGGVAAVLVLIVFASLAFYWWDESVNPAGASVNTLDCVWMFSLGALCALGVARTNNFSRLRERAWFDAAGSIAAWVGLAVVLAYAVYPPLSTPFSRTTFILPVAGAALYLLGGGVGGRVGVGRAMAFAPIQRIGDWSYSIYLWHWPLLVLSLELGSNLRFRWSILVIAISVVLAALTKKFIEDPLRQYRGWSGRPWIAFTFAGVSAAVFIVLAVGLSPHPFGGIVSHPSSRPVSFGVQWSASDSRVLAHHSQLSQNYAGLNAQSEGQEARQ